MPVSEPFIVERGGGHPIHILGDEITVKVSSRDTDGAFTTFEGHIPPRVGPPLHVHHDQDECFHILEGKFVFEVEDTRIHAGPGDTIYAPRGKRHTFMNIGSTAGRIVTTAVPGGLDLFFEELEQLVPRGAKPDPEKLLPLFHKYKMELLGPPLAAREAATAAGAD